ncbi:MAG: peptide chain release factor N(5)-glutamine methyltransferase [Chitinophagaceae bacterium]|nr:peptide chain release factor N(5)-glutamine methyltransferase [Chitinophagaceae bacterium]
MILQEAYRFACNTLENIYDTREAANIANMVMEHITGLNRMDRLLHNQTTLTALQQQQLHEYTSLLCRHTPVQYVLQQAWFYNIPFFVNKHVLIPRPETEELVNWIIQDEKNKPGLAPTRILDIGTGSGCIAVSLKKNLPAAEIHALDVSSGALEVARKNAEQQEVLIHFHETDILQPEKASYLPAFDIIVSNPPYIPLKDKAEMHANVLEHEPFLALFVNDNNPLLFYHTIANFAKSHLKRNGALYLELYETMGRAATGLFLSAGFQQILLKKDMQGKDRMLKVERI